MPLPTELQVLFDRIRARTKLAVPWPSTKKVDTAFLDNLKDVELIAADLETRLPPPAPPVPPVDPEPDPTPEPEPQPEPEPVVTRGPTVTTPHGIWTLDPQGTVLLNGAAVGGVGREFWFLADVLYLSDGGGWYRWTGSSFNPIAGTPDGSVVVPPVDPNPTPTPTPDPVEPAPVPAPDLPPAPAPLREHPRTLIAGTEGLTALRAQIKADAVFRRRWQTAITQFEDTTDGGFWGRDDKSGDAYNRGFAAFLTAVRRADDNVGLTWANSWQYYRDRIVRDAQTYTEVVDNVPVVGWNPASPLAAVGLCFVYDMLFNDLSSEERAWFEARIAQIPLRTSLGYGSECWDNGNSIGHVRAMLRSIVAPDWEAHIARAYADHAAVMDTVNWMPMGFGLGREWHDGYPSRNGHLWLARCLQNAGGYSDAQTVDKMATHLRDVWLMTSLATMPSLANDVTPEYWGSTKFHTQDTYKAFHLQDNVASAMLWSAALLPGALARKATTLALDPSESVAPALAHSEADYFAHLWHKFNEAPIGLKPLRNILNFKYIGFGSPVNLTQPRQTLFYAFPAWLLYNVQDVPGKTADAAGIPLVKRWWPGTTDWTMIQSSHDRAKRTALFYVHRRYGASTYEGGTRMNGSWSLERTGPLLIRRGTGGHSYPTRFGTPFNNGCVCFFKPDLYAEFGAPTADKPLGHFGNAGNDDMGGQRLHAPAAGDTKTSILKERTADFGEVTAWAATPRVVAITSDLLRAYNSTAVQYGDPTTNGVKIAGFVREFVRITDDGSGRGKVFTYDRIALADLSYIPMYALCPGPPPDIDGTETVHLPWGPTQWQQGFDWWVIGPTRWDYRHATRLIVDHTVEPALPNRGDGKACVTWLRPSGDGVTIRKMGGHHARKHSGVDGDPHFDLWGKWWGEQYSKYSGLDQRAHVGDSTVYVMPTTPQADTRFLIACEDMAVGDTPSVASELPCDPLSVAARCGASVVVFGKDGVRASGWVDVPAGVTLVTVVNLPSGVKEFPVTQAGRVEFS